jgi:hypothetical protein
MWFAQNNGISYRFGWDDFLLSTFLPDYSSFSGEVMTIYPLLARRNGYDDWIQLYPKKNEIDTIAILLDSLQKNPRRVHIAGVSCGESISLIRAYYDSLWYGDTLTSTYFLPRDTSLTVSISLRHLLWCDKDKDFLSKAEDGCPYYAVVPPLRSPHDLRSLQQATRMGIIMGMDVSNDTMFVPEILIKQILTPFELSQVLFYNWEKYGFNWIKNSISFPFPVFKTRPEDVSL